MSSFSLVKSRVGLELNSSFPIIQSVIDGSQRGDIYTNSRGDYWVLHKAGFSELFTVNDDAAEWFEFIQTDSVPTYFHVYNMNERILSGLSNLKNLKVRVRNRIRLVNSSASSKNYLPVNDEYEVSKVTNDAFERLSIFNLNLDNKFWSGKREFIDKSMAVVISDKAKEPLAICYAASIASKQAEIDVFTNESYRGKGLAKSAVGYFINYCFEKKIAPSWDCFEDNIASLRTAMSLDFLEEKKYKFISIFNNRQL